MKRCGVCLDPVARPHDRSGMVYHDKCLRGLVGTSRFVASLDFTRTEFFTKIAPTHCHRMSISGAQPKLSMKRDRDHLVPTQVDGTHIFKPSPERFPQASENEHLSMLLGKLCGIDTPDLGLVEFAGGERGYLIRRFDRRGTEKIEVEDLTQLLEIHRERTGQYKYSRSYEEALLAVRGHVGGKLICVLRLFERLVFNFLIHNGDFHLKNISLIGPLDSRGRHDFLSPNYDSLNTRLYFPEESELALDLLARGELSRAFEVLGFTTRADLRELGRRVGLSDRVVTTVFERFIDKKQAMLDLIAASFLGMEFRMRFAEQLRDRFARIDHDWIG